MNLSDARHNINSLVVSGRQVHYDEECWELFRESWKEIQDALNRAYLLEEIKGNLRRIGALTPLEVHEIIRQGQGSTEVCDDCAQDMC